MKLVTNLLYEGARMPERGHDIDVGLDVYVPKAGVLLPGANKIPTGISIEVPIGYSAEIRPRTGMASGEKTLDLKVKGKNATVKEILGRGIAILAQSPPIDPGYTGEVHMIIYNGSDLTIEYPAGVRFGQLVVYPIVYATPSTGVDKSRGSDGFGSTGI